MDVNPSLFMCLYHFTYLYMSPSMAASATVPSDKSYQQLSHCSFLSHKCSNTFGTLCNLYAPLNSIPCLAKHTSDVRKRGGLTSYWMLASGSSPEDMCWVLFLLSDLPTLTTPMKCNLAYGFTSKNLLELMKVWY